jgi:hypothetical protein
VRGAIPSSYALAATAAPICADMFRISLKDGNNCLLARCSGLISEASDSAAPHTPNVLHKQLAEVNFAIGGKSHAI